MTHVNPVAIEEKACLITISGVQNGIMKMRKYSCLPVWSSCRLSHDEGFNIIDTVSSNGDCDGELMVGGVTCASEDAV